MKLLIRSCLNGYILKRYDVSAEYVVVSASLDENENIAAILEEIRDVMEPSCGKREKKNIRIAKIPGHDAEPIKEEAHVAHLLDLLSDILSTFAHQEGFVVPEDQFCKKELAAAIAAYRAESDMYGKFPTEE